LLTFDCYPLSYNPPELIDLLYPQLAIICVAASDKTGLSSPETLDAFDGYNLLRNDPNGLIETIEYQSLMRGELQKNRLRHRHINLAVQVLFALNLGPGAGETGPGQRQLHSPETLFQWRRTIGKKINWALTGHASKAPTSHTAVPSPFPSRGRGFPVWSIGGQTSLAPASIATLP
jgi:hypothetical protein